MATATATTAPEASAPKAAPHTRAKRIAARTGILLVALFLAALVIRQGIANWLIGNDPHAAIRFAPSDARIAAEAARAATEAGTSPSAPDVRVLVHAALRRDVTVVPAIELRALDTQEQGDKAKAARLFSLSNSISRRNLATRLWLIEQSVGRGDVAGALDQFDIALRTSSAAPDVLLPVLARATSDPALVAPIARVLDRPTEWRAMFLHYAIRRAGAASDIANVVLRMRDRRMITSEHVHETLIGQLVEEGNFDSARRVYDAFYPAGGGELVRDGRFADPRASFPFGWDLADKGKVGAIRDVAAGHTVLAYRSTPGGDGSVATQLVTLSPGDYRLLVTSGDAAVDPTAPPYWTLTCANPSSTQIALLDQPTGQSASALSDFHVPTNCAAQWLVLTLRMSDAAHGQTGSIASVAIISR